MGAEWIYWFQDVSEHLRVSRRRKRLRRPGKGFEYTGEKYKNVVQRVVSQIHPERMRLRVSDIIERTPTTSSFHLERMDGPVPPFRPGQYINVFVEIEGIKTSRPYSIASPPGSKYLELTVRKKTNGFVSSYLLNTLKIGDELGSTGPAGSFYHEPLIDGQDLIFLAGGSGITPFMSVIRDAVIHDRPLGMILLYGSRVPGDIIYGEEIKELADKWPRLHYTPVISEPPKGYTGVTGFLSADLIREHVGDVSGKTFYICGPSVMYEYCLSELKKLGVPGRKIRHETYGPAQAITKEEGWPQGLSPEAVFEVEVKGKKTIQAKAGEPLMNSLERHGITLPAICRSGACSTCRIRLLSGKVYMPAHVNLRESDRQNGYIHACMAYPLEKLRIRL